MTHQRSIAFSLILICLLGLPVRPQSAGSVAGAPVVRKIEPPNWWTSLTPELTLLLTGENFTDARVESTKDGASVLDSAASANGHYLFIHLRLSPDLPARGGGLRFSSPA